MTTDAQITKTESAVSLSLALFKLRREWGLTQAELAKKSGTKKAYISHIECGRVSYPSFDLVCRLSDALGVTVDHFRAEMEGHEHDR